MIKKYAQQLKKAKSELVVEKEERPEGYPECLIIKHPSCKDWALYYPDEKKVGGRWSPREIEVLEKCGATLEQVVHAFACWLVRSDAFLEGPDAFAKCVDQVEDAFDIFPNWEAMVNS